MIIKTGVDIVSFDRFLGVLRRRGYSFLARFMREEEIRSFGGLNSKASSLAGVWCAKEAVSKAIGHGIGNKLSFHDMMIGRDEFGCPYVIFFNEVDLHFGISNSSISISHDGGFVISVCTLVMSKW